jgi:hypothetical protein
MARTRSLLLVSAIIEVHASTLVDISSVVPCAARRHPN